MAVRLLIVSGVFFRITADESQLRHQENDPNLSRFQDVNVMIKQQPTLYLAYQNFPSTSLYKCHHIIFGTKSDNYYTSTLKYMVSSSGYIETRNAVKITLETTQYPKEENPTARRSAPNALRYTRYNEAGSGEEFDNQDRTYPLIYYDGSTCSILRVPHENGGFGCEMYASSYKNQQTENCKTTYMSSCGTAKYSIWDGSCADAIESEDFVDFGDR